MDRNYGAKTFILKYLYFNEAWSSEFCWHYQNLNHADKNTSKIK